MPAVKYRLLEVPAAVAVYFLPSGIRPRTASACAAISTVISLHCVSLDSIRSTPFPSLSCLLPLRREKVGRAEKTRSKHRSILFHPPAFAVHSLSLFLFSSFTFFLQLSLFAVRSPPLLSLSVGVNLSPRLSPNTELYKLKPISLPRLPSSFSGYFIFVYLLSANMPGLLRSSQATGSGAVPAISCLHA